MFKPSLLSLNQQNQTKSSDTNDDHTTGRLANMTEENQNTWINDLDHNFLT